MTTTFGQALADARQQQHLSQRALAGRVGVRQTAVAQWEQGRTKPSNMHVFTVERVLGLAPGTLARHLGFGPPTNPPAQRLPGVTDAIHADHSLNDQTRQLLIARHSASAAFLLPRSSIGTVAPRSTARTPS